MGAGEGLECGGASGAQVGGSDAGSEGADRRNTTAQDVAKEVLKLVGGRPEAPGKRLNAAGPGRDACILAQLMEIAESGVTVAERLLAAYHGPWKRDLRRAFADVRV